jgi:hypothetical protein
MGGLIFGLVIGAAVLFVPVFIGVVIWRGRQVKVLAERGVNVEGRVVRRFRSGSTKGSLSRGRRIEFEYVGPDGKTYTRYHNATRNEWEALTEGCVFPLVCLPDDPGVSAARAMVEAARTALRKRAPHANADGRAGRG